MSGHAFKTRADLDQFWREITEVIERYPYILDSLDSAYEHQETDDLYPDDKPYDPTSPKVIIGAVLLLGVSNLDGDDSWVLFQPTLQNSMITAGLVASAAVRYT